MPHLLHVEASPRGNASISTILARPFVAALQVAGWSIDHLLLWREALPEFDGPALAAKYAVLQQHEHDAEEASAWSSIATLVDRLARADHLLISTPMWNFGIPYKLKHWFDLVTQPRLTFTFDERTGYAPVLAPRPVTVILASAGDYRTGPSWGRPDLASGYLRAALAFIGLTDAEVLLAGATLGDPSARDEAQAVVAARLTAIAAELVG